MTTKTIRFPNARTADLVPGKDFEIPEGYFIQTWSKRPRESETLWDHSITFAPIPKVEEKKDE